VFFRWISITFAHLSRIEKQAILAELPLVNNNSGRVHSVVLFKGDSIIKVIHA
jgi:hypothetical protein